MRAARILLLMSALVLVLLAVCAIRHWSYYALEAGARPQHDQHGLLRSSGDFGLLCGVAGTLLFLLNLTYLLRKRLAHLAWLGNLRGWMDFHVATGLVGAGLILVHSAFLVRSAPGALATTCLAVVVTTGVIGRYLYSLVPRSLTGRELERAELRRRFHQHREELAAIGVELPVFETIATADISVGRGLVSRLIGVLAGDRAMRREFRTLQAQIRSHPQLGAQAEHVVPLARGLLREAQWLTRYSDLRGLMGSWRFLHRWLAITMIIVVAFHIGIALRYGDLHLPTRFLP